MTITDIQVQKKNENKVSVFVDGKYAFSLTIEELGNQKLKIGQVISGEKLAEMKDLSKLTNHFIRLIGLILSRPRSEYELRTNLRQKKLDVEEIEWVLTKLKDSDYIDDERFCRWWVEGRISAGRSSRSKLNAELRQKGVDGKLVELVLAEEFTEEDEKKALKKLVEKRKDKYDTEQKLMAHLASKGFNYSLIKGILKELDGDSF